MKFLTRQLLILVSSTPQYIASAEYYCGVNLTNVSSWSNKNNTRRIQWVVCRGWNIILWSNGRFKDAEKKQCIICTNLHWNFPFAHIVI